MTECSSCGTELASYQTRCSVCGRQTAYYHRQRRCLHCGMPAAEKAHTCMMCGKPIDSLPLKTSLFSGSWLGIILGGVIVAILVGGMMQYQQNVSGSTPIAKAEVTSPVFTLTPQLSPASSTPTATFTPTDMPTVTPTPPIAFRTHIVESGENPYLIADQYGVTVKEILTLNHIVDETMLQVGQELLIPPGTKADSNGATAADFPKITYEVESGDTLLGIALKYKTSVQAIRSANRGVDLNILSVGQKINIPLATPAPPATPTATFTPSATPGPPFLPPNLLSPPDKQVVNAENLVFNWTATGLLAENEFYVLKLNWADGSAQEAWLKNNNYRLAKNERPTNGLITWTVTILRKLYIGPTGDAVGESRTSVGEQRTVEWR